MSILRENQTEFLQTYTPDLQIGRDTLRAFKEVETDPVVVTAHFATPPDGEFTEPVPGDVGLEASMTRTCLVKGEIGLGPQLPQWFNDYTDRTGLHAPGSVYIEVPYEENGEWTYPRTDPLWQAVRQGIQLPQGAHYITTFPHNESRELCREAGLNPVQTFDPMEVGDKSRMREYFEKHGYSNIPFGLVHSSEDLEQVIDLLRSHGSPKAWLKVMRSSGGEGVKPITIGDMSNNELRAALTKTCLSFRELSESVYGNNGYADLFDAYWTKGSLAPNDGILIECDASVMGDPGPSSSNIMIVSEGQTREIATFTQIVSADGKFLGSTLVEKTNRVLSPDSPLAHLGQFAESLGFRGIMGADYFRKNQQVIEGNMRIPFSGYALLAFQNLEAHAHKQGTNTSRLRFAQSTIHFPTAIRSLEDLQEYLGDLLYTGNDPRKLREGAVVPWRLASAELANTSLELGDIGILVTADEEERMAEILSIAKECE